MTNDSTVERDSGPVLEIRNVSKSYGPTHALADVTIQLVGGEIHGLAGENGAGKSTLIKVMSGAVAPDAGTIVIDGQPMKFHGPRDAINAGVRVVHQELSILNHLSVAENLLMGDLPRRHGLVRRKELHRHARRLLEPVGLSDLDVHRSAGELSLAQQQLVEIARALRGNPRVLLLDEPSAILGGEDLDRLFPTLLALSSSGVAILYISHRLGELFDLTQRVTTLRDGRLVRTAETADLDTDSLIELMTGRTLVPPERTSESLPRGNPVIAVDNVWAGKRVRGVSLALHAGEIVCMTGLVGAGRTEFARAVIGADPLSKGDFLMHGERCRMTSPRIARRLGIGYLSENRKEAGLLLERSILENLSLTSLSGTSRFGVVSKRRERQAGLDLVKAVDIRCRSVDSPILELSGGNQQKVLIARWIAAAPAVLILDEPTRGVDVAAKSELYSVIRTLADSGVAVLVISSEIEEVLMISDRVLVMREGVLSGEFVSDGITEENIARASFAISGENGVSQ